MMQMTDKTLLDDFSGELPTCVVRTKSCQQVPMVLNERYICCEQIGEGGLSLVYRAKESYAEYFNDVKDIAIKMPILKLMEMKDIAAFVYAEYKILSRLQHPNIVKVFDFGINKLDELPYIVLERLQGQLLDEVPLHTIEDDRKMKLFDELGAVITYMHEQGVVHADIAPNNIMVLENGSISLFDFGISQIVDDETALHFDFSKVRAYNPTYAAPELLAGGSPTKESDIFSFACVMFELFTGSLPFNESPSELHEKDLTKKQLNMLPGSVRKWFKRALHIDPQMRIHTFKKQQKSSIFRNRS